MRPSEYPWPDYKPWCPFCMGDVYEASDGEQACVDRECKGAHGWTFTLQGKVHPKGCLCAWCRSVGWDRHEHR